MTDWLDGWLWLWLWLLTQFSNVVYMTWVSTFFFCLFVVLLFFLSFVAALSCKKSPGFYFPFPFVVLLHVLLLLLQLHLVVVGCILQPFQMHCHSLQSRFFILSPLLFNGISCGLLVILSRDGIVMDFFLFFLFFINFFIHSPYAFS